MSNTEIPTLDFSKKDFTKEAALLQTFKDVLAAGGFNNSQNACNAYLSVDDYIYAINNFVRIDNESTYCVGRYKMHLFIKP